MSDYISRQAAADALQKRIYALQMMDKEPDAMVGLALAIKIIGELPSAPVREVKRGRWIQVLPLDENGNATYECSCCHKGEVHVPIVEVSYCWNCGADMREAQKT